jgi:CRISPR-associated protein Cst2
MSDKKIFSISINGRITLNMHSLNNEGGEGNQILTRQVTIVDKEGKTHNVNAVSGDMLKHIQAEHLYYIAKEENLNLCESCKNFNANRISGDSEFSKSIKGKGQVLIIDEMIKKCLVDDLEGILITNDNNNLPRKSCAEFGWLIGLPEKNKTESFFHVKLVSDAGTKEKDSSNQGQNIFHRPANSGIYALVSNFDIYKISYNDISKKYVLEDKDIETRYKAFLKSILYTFIKPKGAMRNTQNPHIVNFEGAVSISYSPMPAPTISPIEDGYKEQIKKIAENLNRITSSSIEIKEFNDLGDFTNIMSDMIANSAQYKLKQ